jgi:predicted transcriptional regulator
MCRDRHDRRIEPDPYFPDATTSASTDAPGRAVGDAYVMSIQKTSAGSLTHVRVCDCMHSGLLTCDTDDSLRHVATIMANHRVHAVVVTASGVTRPIGIVSDLDVVAALAVGADCAAGEVAATETLTVSADEPLRGAAQLMSEHAVSHLVVLDGAGGYPVGVLSTLDIASVYAES